ncbi:MAG: DUF2335 domain-containing protein [Methylophilaceae bacterium]|nr:DUF2335 domain-containing protein [Methylophilaceae bacterium]
MTVKRKSASRQTKGNITVKPQASELEIPGTQAVEKRVAQVVSQHASYEGPIPHPDVFRKYGEVVADAPERILAVFEQDSKHARDIQMAALDAQRNDNKRIHWMAWSLVVIGFVLSGLFAAMDKDLLATALLTTTIGAIAYSFLTGEKNKTNGSNNS